MADETDDDSWLDYFVATRGQGPRPLLERALSRGFRGLRALDLGAGALMDVPLLLERFDEVIAIDREKAPPDFYAEFPPERFSYVESSFEEYAFPENHFDLVSSQFALPFCRRAKFESVFNGLARSVRPGGIFVGHFFGPRDVQAENPDVTIHPRKRRVH